MIPLTIRTRMLASKALLCKRPAQQRLMLSKLYTTDSSKDELTQDEQQQQQQPHHEEAKQKDDLEVWELASSRDRPTTSRVVQRHASESREILNFSQFLEDIVKNKEKRPEDAATKATPPPLSSASEAAVAEHILELIKNTKPFHKRQKPLPQSAVGPINSGIAQAPLFHRQEPDDPEDDPLLDYLSPAGADDYNWDQTAVSKDERIAAKQEEMEATQAVVEAPTTLDLWHHIENEINRESYPSYYPAVLTKAIEHASKTDPYLALTIFEKAKHRSVVSYISGCTVQAYNAMLLLRWEVWRDINGMLDLAEEMTVNGIEFDNQSRKIVRAAVHEVESEGGGYLDPQDNATDGVFWNADEKRSCNLLKELAGKWMISE